MYVRNVKGKTLTFAVSGKLWKRSLVMIDKPTGSLWSHILGKAMAGELKGTELDSIPSVITDWKSWKMDYPQTTVAHLRRTSRKFQTDIYRDPTRFVMGYASGEKSRAWGFEQLKKHPVINDTFNRTAMLVVFSRSSSAPYLYERNVDGKTLQFQRKAGKLVDTGTSSEWSLSTGKCINGKLKGKQLLPIAGIISFRKAWRNFHPKSTYWSPSSKHK